MEFRSYKEAEEFLLGFVNYEAHTRWPTYNTQNFDLERFAALLERIGAPHRRPGLIHVAGTKGKGSTCALLASILTAAGLTTGLYTSPHLTSFRERIQIDGREIGGDDFARLAGEIAAQIEAAPAASAPSAGGYRTTFELLTAMGLRHFAEQGCDAAVIETGLGGRLDATNVVSPTLTAITALALDHQHVLGNTLAQIAREKGGIIKPGVPCVIAPQAPAAECEGVPALLELARERGSEVIRAEDAGELETLAAAPTGTRVLWTSKRPGARQLELALPLIGAHQVANLRAALAAVEALEAMGWTIGDEAIRRGVANARIAARCEIVGTDPLLVLDGAHCPLSMRATVETVARLWPERRVVVCYSCLSDKNTRETLAQLAQLPGLARIVAFAAPSPRALPPAEIETLCGELGLPVSVAPSPEAAMAQALDAARASSGSALILATGSLYPTAQLRAAYQLNARIL